MLKLTSSQSYPKLQSRRRLWTVDDLDGKCCPSKVDAGRMLVENCEVVDPKKYYVVTTFPSFQELVKRIPFGVDRCI